MKTIAIAIALSSLASSAAAEGPGLRIARIHIPHHDAEARVAVRYPRGAGGTPTRHAEDAVVQGIEAFADADPAQGTFPVVLFSHGMGGTDRAQAWLGAGLADLGAIVVMFEPPQLDLARGRHVRRCAAPDPRRRSVEGA
ncbi:hypothetical protein [Roseicyclus mahoneyensis]|uniref:Dienelactone hydrolase n=1 Tax=Roseicyclus mahoneyensis TaxID=164332 RepID=A0A316GS64_9RHOB|nr:hypothetical protein [Roseicyclus mahoneyensis]PWK62912.1 hypothetical protein C7455_101952 [Roseicyclus mahoneyensis]